MNIVQATRQSIKPLICLYSESGCGKTYSSLLLARGLAGNGELVLCDTESQRGSLYADVIPGGYKCLNIEPPFSPARAIEAIDAVEKSGVSVGIMDSASHFWEGFGGVLDMAATNEEKSGKAGLHNWKKPKLEHQMMMLRFLQSKITWVICLRAKHKTRQGKDERGKTCIIKDDFTTPIQSDDFIFEMTAHMEILHDHSIRITKCSHPELRKCFPSSGPITIETGKLIAQWCSSGSAPKTAPQPAAAPVDELKAAKANMWNLAKPIHGGKKEALESWLVHLGLIPTGTTLEQLTLLDIETLIPQIENSLPKE